MEIEIIAGCSIAVIGLCLILEMCRNMRSPKPTITKSPSMEELNTEDPITEV